MYKIFRIFATNCKANIMKSFIKNYSLSIFIILVIIYLSFFTPPKTDVPTLPGMDKVVHFCMYGGLTTLLWIQYFWCHKGIKWSHLIIGGIICPIVMSGLIEIGQSTLTETRSGDWWDFVANTIGVCTATLFSYYVLRSHVYKYKNKKHP